jgi:hypothetical protein
MNFDQQVVANCAWLTDYVNSALKRGHYPMKQDQVKVGGIEVYPPLFPSLWHRADMILKDIISSEEYMVIIHSQRTQTLEIPCTADQNTILNKIEIWVNSIRERNAFCTGVGFSHLDGLTRPIYTINIISSNQ